MQQVRRLRYDVMLILHSLLSNVDYFASQIEQRIVLKQYWQSSYAFQKSS